MSLDDVFEQKQKKDDFDISHESTKTKKINQKRKKALTLRNSIILLY